jgi:hypothetical protein
MLTPSSGLKCVGSGIFAQVYRWSARMMTESEGSRVMKRILTGPVGKNGPFKGTLIFHHKWELEFSVGKVEL